MEKAISIQTPTLNRAEEGHPSIIPLYSGRKKNEVGDLADHRSGKIKIILKKRKSEKLKSFLLYIFENREMRCCGTVGSTRVF